MFGIPPTADYKKKKQVLPEAHSPNLKVNEDWDEMKTHYSGIDQFKCLSIRAKHKLLEIYKEIWD